MATCRCKQGKRAAQPLSNSLPRKQQQQQLPLPLPLLLPPLLLLLLLLAEPSRSASLMP
jgi:hypothetical protein